MTTDQARRLQSAVREQLEARDHLTDDAKAEADGIVAAATRYMAACDATFDLAYEITGGWPDSPAPAPDAVCACGHTSRWHAGYPAPGPGDCEHDGACRCKAFEPVS